MDNQTLMALLQKDGLTEEAKELIKQLIRNNNARDTANAAVMDDLLRHF